ncbi:MAG: acyl carrier protein phosphodiesterase [Polyangiales bacterium]|jgi:acyl carrier protein phosphodiesterase
MNFFGHTVIGQELDSSPSFLFGTMLPDFVSMSGARFESVADDAPARRELLVGIEVHHATDAVFHSTPHFLRYCSALTVALEKAGVRRGTAMAVGHIGAELLLDRWLLHFVDSTPYMDAIAYGKDHSGFVQVTKGAGPRLGGLMERLLEYKLSGYQSIEVIRTRLERALCERPRLSVEASAAQPIEECLTSFDEAIREDASEWRESINTALREHPRYVAASERLHERS